MGKIIIHFRYNKTTGKKDIYIAYESEGDMLPYEHERRHREIVEKLMGQDIGEIHVERVGQKIGEIKGEKREANGEELNINE